MQNKGTLRTLLKVVHPAALIVKNQMQRAVNIMGYTKHPAK